MVNSRYPRFSATGLGSACIRFTYFRHTLSRSYGVNLPSSLERLLSNALGYSPCPPVSVCGTVTTAAHAGTFLGSRESLSLWTHSVLLITSRSYAHWFVSRWSPQHASYWLEPSIPRFGSAILLRPSCIQRHPWWCRNINLLAITYAIWPRLRSRLTLGR